MPGSRSSGAPAGFADRSSEAPSRTSPTRSGSSRAVCTITHCAGKEELLYLVVEEPISRLYATVDAIVAAELPAAEKLRRATVAHLEAFDRHHPHLFVYLRETANLTGRFRASAPRSPKQYERFWQQILREGMKSGEFRADLDVQVVSYGLLGMLNWLYKWYEPGGRLSVQEVAAQFALLALGGLAATAAPVRRSRRRRRR